MTDCVLAKGFGPDDLLSEERVLVPNLGMSVSVATDDLLHFLQDSAEEIGSLTEMPLAALERVLETGASQ